MDPRLSELKSWSAQMLDQLGETLSDNWQCSVVAGDASFRRYFRITDGDRTWIVVDAPPEKEDSQPFVEVARCWRELDVNVPDIKADDLQQGFMLLEDFGDIQFLPELSPETADALYGRAFAELLKLQRCMGLAARELPPYDAAMLQREVDLFRDWFLTELLQVSLSDTDGQALDQFFSTLINSALEQPQVCVHRDYHSRNLMLCSENRVGVIDFQDAVMGPVTYDLVSLLRDCYIAWPDQDVERWLSQYWELVQQDRPDQLGEIDLEQFRIWFDRMGMQRHLKAVGIFARLKIRDGKAGYLQDIPRTMSYLLDVGGRYPEHQGIVEWLRADVVPLMSSSGLFDQDAMQRWLD
ncbi:phosphotransferase [Pontibacterium sp. N1Y112]|uniref:Phosphotransferase n=1 Tax=Pontibacterium sinense TaxID=2781979 RepID=A0A8J7F920_9GAMM|nr:phosphotransferase [Pontibacterium sinense]MBE9396452.1 phosphotransferase [Pontibacterium sinense]